MKEIEISSHFISAKISTKGAELKSLVDSESNIEYMWQADPKIWGRTAPVLFPIVGSLRDDQYRIGRKFYVLGRHGFARDMEFDVVEVDRDSVLLRLSHTDETLTYYPFKFNFEIRYKVYGPKLIISYEVKNVDRKEMFFSLGFHPAFNIPMRQGELEDYYLEFDFPETRGAYFLHDGLIDFHSVDDKKVLSGGRRIHLDKDIFNDDALIFKDPTSRKMTLKNTADEHSVSVEFGDIPYLGVWSPPGAPFVCIEPWYGVADAVDSNNDFSVKEGLQSLEQEKSFKCDFTIHVN